MGVKLKKYKGKWYLFIDYDGKRKAKCLGTDRKLAESIKRQVEAKLVLGGLGVFGTEEEKLPTFETKGRRVQPSIPLHVINHLPASVFSFANISEQNSLYCHPCQSEILVQHLRYPPNVIGEQVSVLHSGSGVHMAQGLHATLQRHAQGILRSSVAVTESVQATLETQSFQHWGDHPMGKVVRVQPLTFLRQKQRLVRPSPSGQFAQARCQPRRDGKRPRSFALGVGDVLSEQAAAEFAKAARGVAGSYRAVETHVA